MGLAPDIFVHCLLPPVRNAVVKGMGRSILIFENNPVNALGIQSVGFMPPVELPLPTLITQPQLISTDDQATDIPHVDGSVQVVPGSPQTDDFVNASEFMAGARGGSSQQESASSVVESGQQLEGGTSAGRQPRFEIRIEEYASLLLARIQEGEARRQAAEAHFQRQFQEGEARRQAAEAQFQHQFQEGQRQFQEGEARRQAAEAQFEARRQAAEAQHQREMMAQIQEGEARRQAAEAQHQRQFLWYCGGVFLFFLIVLRL